MSKDRQTDAPNAVGALRRARGLSKEGLAWKAGLSLRTVERIEAGQVQPHRTTKRVLAHVLGVEQSELGFADHSDDPDLLPAA